MLGVICIEMQFLPSTRPYSQVYQKPYGQFCREVKGQ